MVLRFCYFMDGRMHLSLDDIRAVAPSVLRHRIIVNFDAHADGKTPDLLLTEILDSVSAAIAK